MRKFNKNCIIKVDDKDYFVKYCSPREDGIIIKLEEDLTIKVGKIPYALGSKFTSKCGKWVKFKGNLYI